MTEHPSRWLAWRERVVTADGKGYDIPTVLRGLASEIADACPRGAKATRRWAATGLSVREAPMRGRGRCDVSADAPVLYINRIDNRYAQHFTVAHEIGHLLLNSFSPERLRGVSHRQEEDLCDEFAQRVVVPPDELAAELNGEPPALDQVLRICGLFEANPGTVVRALGSQLHLDRYAYLLARWRGHYRRPGILGFRIDAAAGPEALYWPLHQRVEGLGLEDLAKAAEEAEHGAFFEGFDEKVTVQLRKVETRSRHNVMTGPVRWQAVRQGRKRPYLLAIADCSLLAGERLANMKDNSPPSVRHSAAVASTP
jgi:hypothetical protein